jgi:hypothetical protein
MKSTAVAYLCFALFVTSVQAAGEPDGRTPLERYQGDGEFALITCKISLRMALGRAELGQEQDDNSDVAGCIEKGKSATKKSFDAALRTVKRAKAKEALKSYHVSLVGALEGIRPGSSERKISYEQRQQALEGKLTEAWARFEVEQ